MIIETDAASKSSPSADQIIGQIDAEIASRTSEEMKHGWTASNILPALLPLLWLLVTQFGAHWEGPVGVLYRWAALFLLFSLFFDVAASYPTPTPRPFFLGDIRGRLQWTDLLSQQMNAFDLGRYFLLLAILTYFRFPVEWYTQLLVGLFYGILFCVGLLTSLLRSVPILIPLEPVQRYLQWGRLVLSATGFVSGWLFLGVILDNSDQFHSTDLLIAGTLVSISYLLRRFKKSAGGSQVIKVLREIRRDLAVGDVDELTAKRRYVAVTSGMTLAEAVADYTRPVSLLLNMAREEMNASRGLLASLRESVEAKKTQALSTYEPQFSELWAAQKEHFNAARQLFDALNQVGRLRRYRLHNHLVGFYRRRCFRVLSAQTRAEVEALLTGIEDSYAGYLQAERDCLAECKIVEAAGYTHLNDCSTEIAVTAEVVMTFDLSAWLGLMRVALLGNSLAGTS